MDFVHDEHVVETRCSEQVVAVGKLETTGVFKALLNDAELRGVLWRRQISTSAFFVSQVRVKKPYMVSYLAVSFLALLPYFVTGAVFLTLSRPRSKNRRSFLIGSALVIAAFASKGIYERVIEHRLEANGAARVLGIMMQPEMYDASIDGAFLTLWALLIGCFIYLGIFVLVRRKDVAMSNGLFLLALFNAAFLGYSVYVSKS